MTTLLLASQKIFFRASPPGRVAFFGGRSHSMNRRGRATAACLAVIAVGIGLYVFMLISTFGLGVQLREIGVAEAARKREVKDLEMALRSREVNFAVRYTSILDGMDKVTSIIYLDSDGVTMNTRR